MGNSNNTKSPMISRKHCQSGFVFVLFCGNYGETDCRDAPSAEIRDWVKSVHLGCSRCSPPDWDLQPLLVLHWERTQISPWRGGWKWLHSVQGTVPASPPFLWRPFWLRWISNRIYIPLIPASNCRTRINWRCSEQLCCWDLGGKKKRGKRGKGEKKKKSINKLGFKIQI